MSLLFTGVETFVVKHLFPLILSVRPFRHILAVTTPELQTPHIKTADSSQSATCHPGSPSSCSSPSWPAPSWSRPVLDFPNSKYPQKRQIFISDSSVLREDPRPLLLRRRLLRRLLLRPGPGLVQECQGRNEKGGGLGAAVVSHMGKGGGMGGGIPPCMWSNRM